VDEIVLVGGSTRVPRVQQILTEFFDGKTLCKSVHPDEAVAYGAAVQGAILSGARDANTANLLLVDVIPLSLGVECEGRVFAKVVPRNTPVPCKKKSEFTTVYDYQEEIDVRIFEGERANCDGNHLLGEFQITGGGWDVDGSVTSSVGCRLDLGIRLVGYIPYQLVDQRTSILFLAVCSMCRVSACSCSNPMKTVRAVRWRCRPRQP